MASNRLICPHCGHDGTPETSRPPLDSYGFNYLAEGVVCREVRGYDETGRLQLSGDFKCEAAQAANARIECRSCWRTFPVPEGLLWAVVPDERAPVAEAPPATEPAAGADGLEMVGDAIGRNLVSALRSAVSESEQANLARIAKLDADVADLAKAVEDLPSLRSDLTGLRAQTASLAEAQGQSQAKLAAIESGLHAQESSQQQIVERLGALSNLQEESLRKIEGQASALAGLTDQIGQLGQSAAANQDEMKGRLDGLDATLEAGREAASQLRALLAQLQESQQAIRQRLDAQADVIRALHSTALEQTTRREELRAAVQRLEEIAGALNPVKPLPEEL